MSTSYYTVYDPQTGRILHSVTSNDGSYPEDGHYLKGLPPPDGERYVVQDGRFVRDVTPPPAPRHQDLRVAAYPPVGDQLDALWKIVEAMTVRQPAPDDARDVYLQVQAVKAKFPKPEENR